jgi:hypothetical protein
MDVLYDAHIASLAPIRLRVRQPGSAGFYLRDRAPPDVFGQVVRPPG